MPKIFFAIGVSAFLALASGAYIYPNSSVGSDSVGSVISGLVSSVTFAKGQDPQQPAQPDQPPPEQQEPEQQPEQQPAQPYQSEADKYCERPNPDGSNPDVGGTDPNKLGCSCMRTCVSGSPTENYEDGKRCKVHCKPDHCACPNPCTKT